MPLLIRDGFTIEDSFPAQAWMNGFKIKYRPVLPERMCDYQEFDKTNGKNVFDGNVKLLTEHVISCVNPPVIKEGMIIEDTFPGVAWMDKLKFAYRPILPERYYEYDAVDKKVGRDRFEANVKLLIEHLTSWDLFDESGAVVPLNNEKIYSCLPIQLTSYMIDCVLGWGPAHVNVSKGAESFKADDPASYVRLPVQAIINMCNAITGYGPDHVRADEKNSPSSAK